MPRRVAALLTLGAALLFASPQAHAGRIIIIGDEWLLSNDAFAASSINATNLALNVASFVRGGAAGGNLLAYSNNGAAFSPALTTAYTNAGYNVTVSTAQPFTLATLSGFDAVFLAGTPGRADIAANLNALTSYVNGGGNVVIMAGTGEFGTALGEGNAWSPFLNTFGLTFGNVWFPFAGFVTVPVAPGSSPIQTGVSQFLWGFGQTAGIINPADPLTRTDIIGQFGAGTGDQPVIASYDSNRATAAAPEPGALAFVGLGGLLFSGRFRRR